VIIWESRSKIVAAQLFLSTTAVNMMHSISINLISRKQPSPGSLQSVCLVIPSEGSWLLISLYYASLSLASDTWVVYKHTVTMESPGDCNFNREHFYWALGTLARAHALTRAPALPSPRPLWAGLIKRLQSSGWRVSSRPFVHRRTERDFTRRDNNIYKYIYITQILDHLKSDYWNNEVSKTQT